MKQKNAPSAPPPSKLQGALLPRILEMVRADGLAPGAKLVELAIAQRLGVSRTPVRAALGRLAAQGVARRAARGFVLARRPGEAEGMAEEDAADRLSLTLVGDWQAGALPPELSEADLMRRYAASRPALQRVLSQLAQLAVVERKAGHGWRFLPGIVDRTAYAESYRFRIAVESAALFEPGFQLAPEWLAQMRARHRAVLGAPWRDVSSLGFYEMNAAFHEGLAAASGNRFMLLAVQQQNQLRRVANYVWGFRGDAAAVAARVQASCAEHLQIMDAIEAGATEVAAALMRRHLEQAQRP